MPSVLGDKVKWLDKDGNRLPIQQDNGEDAYYVASDGAAGYPHRVLVELPRPAHWQSAEGPMVLRFFNDFGHSRGGDRDPHIINTPPPAKTEEEPLLDPTKPLRLVGQPPSNFRFSKYQRSTNRITGYYLVSTPGSKTGAKHWAGGWWEMDGSPAGRTQGTLENY